MIDTAKMRRQIEANPGWDTLTAFRELSGMEPSDQQIKQLMHFGGNDDERVKQSIPEQLERAQNSAWVTYPGFAFKVEFHWHDLDLTNAETMEWKARNNNGWAGDYLSVLTEREIEAKAEFMPPHPVVKMYREVLNRDPDPEGLAFWLKVFDDLEMTMPAFRKAFIEGIQ